MIEIWALRVFAAVGWLLVGILLSSKAKKPSIFGDLVIDEQASEVFLHCPHQPEELLDHKYILLQIINLNKDRTFARK